MSRLDNIGTVVNDAPNPREFEDYHAEQGTETAVDFNVEGALISVRLDRRKQSGDPRMALEKARDAVARLARRDAEPIAVADETRVEIRECPNLFAHWAYRKS